MDQGNPDGWIRYLCSCPAFPLHPSLGNLELMKDTGIAGRPLLVLNSKVWGPFGGSGPGLTLLNLWKDHKKKVICATRQRHVAPTPWPWSLGGEDTGHNAFPGSKSGDSFMNLVISCSHGRNNRRPHPSLTLRQILKSKGQGWPWSCPSPAPAPRHVFHLSFL
jgi:hypothetical protein